MIFIVLISKVSKKKILTMRMRRWIIITATTYKKFDCKRATDQKRTTSKVSNKCYNELKLEEWEKERERERTKKHTATRAESTKRKIQQQKTEQGEENGRRKKQQQQQTTTIVCCRKLFNWNCSMYLHNERQIKMKTILINWMPKTKKTHNSHTSRKV